MKWILNLYPSSWQQRYRDEVEALLEVEPKNFRTALDLMTGAIDAWLNPSYILEETKLRSEQTMITASRHNPYEISSADGVRCAIWIIVLSFILASLGVILDKTYGPNIMIQAFLNSSFFIAFTVSCGYTFLKPYSRIARNILIGVSIPTWYLFFLITLVISSAT